MSASSRLKFITALHEALSDSSEESKQWQQWLKWEAARRPREWWRPLWSNMCTESKGDESDDEAEAGGDEEEDAFSKWAWRNVEGSVPHRPTKFPTCSPVKDLKPEDVFTILASPNAGIDDSKVADSDEAEASPVPADALETLHQFADSIVNASLFGSFVREMEDSEVGRALIQLRGVYKVHTPADKGGSTTPDAAASAVRAQLETVGLGTPNKNVQEHKKDAEDAAVVVVRDALAAGAAPSVDSKGLRTTEERAFILRDWSNAVRVSAATAVRRVQEYPPRGYREITGSEVTKKKKPVKHALNFLEGVAAGLDEALGGVRRGREQLLEQVQTWFQENIGPYSQHTPHDEPAWSKCPHLPVKATRAKPNWWKRITIGTVLLASAALAGPLFLAGAGVVGAALGAGGSFIVLAGVQATVGSAAARVVLGSKTSWSTVKKGHEYEDVLMADQATTNGGSEVESSPEGKEEEGSSKEASKKKSPLSFWKKKKKPSERVCYVGSFRWCYFHGPGALYHENDLELMRGEFRLGIPNGKAVLFNPLHLLEKKEEEGAGMEEGMQELEKLVANANEKVAKKDADKGKDAKGEDPGNLSAAVSSGAACGWATVECERSGVARVLETDMETAPSTIRMWLGSRVAQLITAIRRVTAFDVVANPKAPQLEHLQAEPMDLKAGKASRDAAVDTTGGSSAKDAKGLQGLNSTDDKVWDEAKV